MTPEIEALVEASKSVEYPYGGNSDAAAVARDVYSANDHSEEFRYAAAERLLTEKAEAAQDALQEAQEAGY